MQEKGEQEEEVYVDWGDRTPFATPKNEDRERACLPPRPPLLCHGVSAEIASQGKTARLGAAQQPCRQMKTDIDRERGAGG